MTPYDVASLAVASIAAASNTRSWATPISTTSGAPNFCRILMAPASRCRLPTGISPRRAPGCQPRSSPQEAGVSLRELCAAQLCV